MCEAGGCKRNTYARGLCARHYKQVRRHGAVQPDRAPAPCAVPSCGRSAVTRGWCHGHYLRWSRTGDVQVEAALVRPVQGPCSADGCERPRHSGGLCRTHVARVLSGGDPLEPVRRRSPGAGSISHGYRKVIVPPEELHLTRGERNVLQHRLVMAQLLGRPLDPGEVVHHVNGDRLDNRPANLELWSVDQPAGQRVADKLAFALELLDRYAPEAGEAARAALPRERRNPADPVSGIFGVPPSGFEPPLPP